MAEASKPESMLERGNKPASSAGTAFLPFLSAKTASSFGEGSFVQSMSKTIGSACLPLVRPSWVTVWGNLLRGSSALAGARASTQCRNQLGDSGPSRTLLGDAAASWVGGSLRLSLQINFGPERVESLVDHLKKTF